MKQVVFSLLIFFLSITAKAQLGNYNENGNVKILSQKTELKITTTEVEVKSEKESAGAILSGLVGPLIDVGVTAVKEKAKHNAAKFKSTFNVSASASGFWASKAKVNLPTLTIHRTVIKKDKTEEEALKITLTPELSPDKTAFRFIAKDGFVFKYSSAKTKGDYDYIDIMLDIKFKALLLNKSQYELKELRGTSISIPMIKVGTTTFSAGSSYESGWFPLPAMPTIEVETDVTELETKTITLIGTKEGKTVNDNYSSDTKTVKKKSKDKETLSTKAGLYEFEITVTESNPYKIKAENKQKMTEATGDATGILLKTLAESLLKKEEEKKEEQ
jgi:hypothetical protein